MTVNAEWFTSDTPHNDGWEYWPRGNWLQRWWAGRVTELRLSGADYPPGKGLWCHFDPARTQVVADPALVSGAWCIAVQYPWPRRVLSRIARLFRRTR